MIGVELKLGRNTYLVSKRDFVIDNGSSRLVPTLKGGSYNFRPTNVIMSKKLFTDLLKKGLLVYDEALTLDMYGSHLAGRWMKVYRFNIEGMIEAGYPTSEIVT